MYRNETIRSSEQGPIIIKTPVVIVGGSLSGLTLSRELERRSLNHVVLEASKEPRSPSIHYLTSLYAATTLGLDPEYQEKAKDRKLITGYTRYDASAPGLVVREEVLPNSTRKNGFVTFSLEELRYILGSKFNNHVLTGKSVCQVTNTDHRWEVKTTHEDIITSDIVIDATGSRVRVLSNLLGNKIIQDSVGKRTVRACFGGVYPYHGSEDALLFADGFPALGEGIPKEGAGWVMPLGNGLAEVVVGWETTLIDIAKWHTPKLKHLIKAYVKWFNDRGIPIAFDKRQEVVSGSFSQGLLDYRSIPSESGVAAFGESLGLNQPLNGYLIRNIAGYAEIMADEIQRYLNTGKWNPHDMLIGSSPVNFGQQVALSKRKMEAALAGKGRSTATSRLQEFLIKSLHEDGLWNAIDSGIPPTKVMAGIVRNPKYVDIISILGLDYIRLLLTNVLYRKELKEKIIYRFK
ncbi:hypothetical protein A3D77_01970 [Candidatus Gottesmanbacteria bacterium RIFCSPHIGHO2_02_FULL_39_11]|uniref:FAD-binding domain-containing protein n=1 Tax=Candidatus Gottesmanbacteria bacterium RIFCSPHIGHO2_02_FULL_39_11 TaxID=1798382 RepID=A0A1F5ZUC4_9BACT|nr:MAG: hypothetical protein A3D77_01970 [Candidatus Gottesmanbacteria bacterium RIFCSPHIGHO2_02_FULL_39_11]